MTVVEVPILDGNDRPDDHLQLPEFHPLEWDLIERGVCANAEDPSPWVVVDIHSRKANRRAARICREECPVFDECRIVTDHIEASSLRPGTYQATRSIAGIRAGEGPASRSRRREGKEK